MARQMPSFDKAPPELVATFDEVISSFPDLQRRQMFGYPCAFADDQMTTGLFGSDWMVRLPEQGRQELTAAGGAPFAPMPGRPMKEYVTFPRSMLDDPEQLRPWIERALAYVRTLPPKPARKPKARRAASAGD